MKNTKKNLHQENVLCFDHFKQKNSWLFKDLSTNLLPYVQIDFLSLTSHPGIEKSTILSEFQKLNPYLAYTDKNYPEDSPGINTRHLEGGYDIIFCRYLNSDPSKCYLRIPGEFAMKVLNYFLSDNIQFSSFFSSMSRINFK